MMVTEGGSSPFWQRDFHADRRPILLARGAIKSAMRSWFNAQGFIEVETTCLQVSPGNETHLHGFATDLVAPDLKRSQFYLHTSPEFACKKLLAAGERQIFIFAPVFRNRERSALHHPEFTMLEWYRVGAPYEHLMEDCMALLLLAAKVGGRDQLSHGDLVVDPFKAAEHVTLQAAFARYADIDLLSTLAHSVRPQGLQKPSQQSAANIRSDRAALAAAAERIGIRVADDDAWSDIFSRVLTAKIEPELGREQVTILRDYPVPEAALARPAPHDPRLAERFELYACGVELANGFGELTDPVLQRLRFEADMDKRQRIYGTRYPIDEDFIAALAHMPPASGCALGFDRLVMLALGAARIDQVLWTPLPDDGAQ